MCKHSFKKMSARAIRESILMGLRASIDIGHNEWCDVVSAHLIFGPAIVFKMAGGNADQKSTVDHEYKVRLS